MRTRNLSLVLAVIVLLSGCTAMKSRLANNSPTSSVGSDTRSAVSSRSESATPDFGTPEKMLAVWKDSVRTQEGRPPMRGFGGRLYLYDQDGSAIRAEGDLVIYGFDDSVTDREGSKADQKIVLRNKQFQQSYSESALGPSYNVWIDWDEVGGPDKSVTLIPFFRTREGDIVRAGQAIYSLHTPGKNKDKIFKERLASHQEPASDQFNNRVSHANYIQQDGDKSHVAHASAQIESPQRSEPSNKVRTTTIRVPQETQKRLRSSSFVKRSQPAAETTKVVEDDSPREVRSSRIQAAREKRRKEINNGNVFGMPGQL